MSLAGGNKIITYWRFIMSGREKVLRIKMVEVTVGNRHFQVPPKQAEGLILVLSNSEDNIDGDDEGSIPAEVVIPDLLDERRRPATVLRGLRVRDDITQEELAAKIKRPQSWISQMENATRPIGPKMAALLSKAFNINANVFSSTLVKEDSESFLDDFVDEGDRQVGARIKALRKNAELSQLELAAKLDISQAELSKLESGTKILSISRAQALAGIFKNSADYLLTGKTGDNLEGRSRHKRAKA
jgi:transcriptional regulator with XRE-family HTH domain